jgi:hypothetical protein
VWLGWSCKIRNLMPRDLGGTQIYAVRYSENRVVLTAMQYDIERTVWHSELCSMILREPCGTHSYAV